ncbi:MAG: SMP-30/gluconolactonase/LRE family protein [Actinomycetota bacterium]|nr:SMP-30/gluconolactonase/LRE family protein [Actinomycetota bacterium]
MHAAADEVRFANGIVAGPGASQVIVAESFALALTLFDVAPDLSLTNPRLFAQLAFGPDGLTMDTEGCAWVADPTAKRVVRVAEGGHELQSIAFEQSCLSVVLGGHDLRTLYVCTTDFTDPEQSRRSRGSRIETVRVDVPGVA